MLFLYTFFIYRDFYLPHPLFPPLLTRYQRRGGSFERGAAPLLDASFYIWWLVLLLDAPFYGLLVPLVDY